MSKYKVSVYAICKNEEKFIDRWYESMKEADEIYVLDTGSDDNSVEKLKEKGVNVVVEKINPSVLSTPFFSITIYCTFLKFDTAIL